MALILAIEPDHRQAAQIAGIVRHRLNAELILADTTERALDAIGDHIPDLVLVPALLSPQDDDALAAALRVIAAAANVRTLTIPVFASAAPRQASRAVLGRWRRARSSPAPDGCDPAVFAEQISTYLAEAVAERAALEPEPVEEPVIETTRIAADFIVEPPPAIEPYVAFQAVFAPVEAAPAAGVVTLDALFYDAPVAGDTSPLAQDTVGLDAADIIEIDLSDETLEHAGGDEPVFELSLDDRVDAFVDKPAAVLDAPSMAAVVQETAAAPEIAAVPEIFAGEDLVPPPPIADLELWMPLSFGAHRLWPAIEGVVSEYVDLSAEMFNPPVAPKSEHPEWTELIASLRQDLERRRDPVEPTPITRVVPRRKSKPVQDEWGFFDPQQCGFAALLAKLDEITETSDEPASRLA